MANGKNIVLISFGSGESYPISMLHSVMKSITTNKGGIPSSIHVIHSTKNETSDTFQLDETIKQLTNIAKAYDVNISYDKYYTQNNYTQDNHIKDNIIYHEGRISEESFAGILDSNSYFICGPRTASNNTHEILNKLGIIDENIHIEEFSVSAELSGCCLLPTE